jgi:hypothetical protein
MGFVKWFKGLFSKVQDKAKKLWELAEPFLVQLFNDTKAKVLLSLCELALEAVKYVSEQGLPTDEAKRDAFKQYMKEKSEGKADELKDYELALLRETALAIFKSIKG